MAERKIPAPEPNPETKAFWDNCAAGKLTVGKCGDTGKTYWYPRALSPFTLTDKTELVEVSGKGTIYSYSVRSEEHTSELQSLMRISYAVFCLKKKHIHKNKYL